jgi:cytohesin
MWKNTQDASLDVNQWSENGYTPLHLAAIYGTPQSIQALLELGAKVTIRGLNGVTPLHSAAEYGTPANIQASLDADANLMARSGYGKTSPHWAVGQGQG